MAVLIIKNIQIDNSKNIDILIANICTLIMAIFTIINVIYSKGQLLEVKRDVDLSSKPLPWISDKILYVETPNFWLIPGKFPEAKVYSRYGLDLKIKNIGNHPAVGIDVISKLILLDMNDANLYEMKSIDRNFSKLEISEEIEISNLIPLDYENLFLHSIADKSKCSGILTVDILFRNYIGKPFCAEFSYYINANQEKFDLLKQLSDKLISIQTSNSSTLNEIQEQIDLNKNHELLTKSLKNKINYNPDVKFVTDLIEIPENTHMKELTIKEYNNIRKNLDYYKVIKGRGFCSNSLLNNGFEKTNMGEKYIERLIRKEKNNKCC